MRGKVDNSNPASGKTTKMSRDWSTACQLSSDGKPIIKKKSGGQTSYNSKKGDLIWEGHVIPEYTWFNGKMNYTLRETKFDPSQVIKINSFEGSPTDGKSLIWPACKDIQGVRP